MKVGVKVKEGGVKDSSVVALVFFPVFGGKEELLVRIWS